MEPKNRTEKRNGNKNLSRDDTSHVIVNPIGNQDLLDDPRRRRRKRFSFEEKKNILEALNKYPQDVICEKYELSDRTLRKWKAEKEIIIEEGNKANTKKLKKKSTAEEMDDAIYQWLVETQDQGIPISGPMIRRQALIVKENHPKNDQFKASEGWLSGFKRRNKISSLKIAGTARLSELTADTIQPQGQCGDHFDTSNSTTPNRTKLKRDSIPIACSSQSQSSSDTNDSMFTEISTERIKLECVRESQPETEPNTSQIQEEITTVRIKLECDRESQPETEPNTSQIHEEISVEKIKWECDEESALETETTMSPVHEETVYAAPLMSCPDDDTSPTLASGSLDCTAAMLSGTDDISLSTKESKMDYKDREIWKLKHKMRAMVKEVSVHSRDLKRLRLKERMSTLRRLKINNEAQSQKKLRNSVINLVKKLDIKPAAKGLILLQLSTTTKIKYSDDEKNICKLLNNHSPEALEILRKAGCHFPPQDSIRNWMGDSEITPGS